MITIRKIGMGLVLFGVLPGLFRCARVGGLSGGEKDKLPPVIISAKPDFKTTNFTGNKITIFFDEYIKLKDLNKQLVISPPLKYPPEIYPQGFPAKQIRIKIKDTLKERTTYTFNFGNAIRDNTEGNILRQFTYLFSTGAQIDSLRLSGTLKDAFQKKAVKNVLVMLYRTNQTYSDSSLFRRKPDYVTNTLDSARFKLENLKAGSYKLFAVQEDNANMLYNPYIDKVAFCNDRITLPTDSVYQLVLFREKPPFSIVKITEKSRNHILIAYEGKLRTSIGSVTDKQLHKIPFIAYKDAQSDSLHLWHQTLTSDTLVIHYKDSVLHDAVVHLRSKQKDSLRLRTGIASYLHPEDSLCVVSNIPLKHVRPDRIILTDKDSTAVPVEVVFAPNRLYCKLHFKRKPDYSYRMLLLPGAVEDFLGQKNDSLQFRFKTKKKEDYGELQIDVKREISENIIVELYDNRGKVIRKRVLTGSSKVVFPSLLPGSYQVRAIVDINKNNVWDTGNVLQKRQPERIVHFSKPIELRANWVISEVFTVK